MTQQVRAVRPAEGLFAAPRQMETVADLFANVWQFGYVTTDLDRAIDYMSERFGLEHCVKLPSGGATFLVGDRPAEWEARFAMGSRGGMIMRFHHPAVFIETGDEAWERMQSILADAGLGVTYTVLIPDRVRAAYVDMTAELGHYLEICQLHKDDTDFFSGLAADSA